MQKYLVQKYKLLQFKKHINIIKIRLRIDRFFIWQITNKLITFKFFCCKQKDERFLNLALKARSPIKLRAHATLNYKTERGILY